MKSKRWSAAALVAGGHPQSLVHLSREIDRTLNQLERLQRMRKGQPALPPIKFDISS